MSENAVPIQTPPARKKNGKERAPAELLMRIVAAECGVTLEDLISTSRLGRLAQARQAIVFFARAAGISFPKLAKALGRDHTTMVYSADRAWRLWDKVPAFRAKIVRCHGALRRAGLPMDAFEFGRAALLLSRHMADDAEGPR